MYNCTHLNNQIAPKKKKKKCSPNRQAAAVVANTKFK